MCEMGSELSDELLYLIEKGSLIKNGLHDFQLNNCIKGRVYLREGGKNSESSAVSSIHHSRAGHEYREWNDAKQRTATLARDGWR